MTTLLNIRALNRSVKVRVKNSNGSTITLNDQETTQVDIDDPDVRRDLTHHSAIGQWIAVGDDTGVVSAAADGTAGLTDDGATTGNGIFWQAVGSDGDQVAIIQTGPGGSIVWRFSPDGGIQMPNGNALYNSAAAPNNALGNNGDWSLGADGHIYNKAAGSWAQVV